MTDALGVVLTEERLPTIRRLAAFQLARLGDPAATAALAAAVTDRDPMVRHETTLGGGAESLTVQ